MEPKKTYPIYLTFQRMSKELKMSQTDLDAAVISGKIKHFLILNLNYKAPEITRNRVTRLTPILNQYVSTYLHEDPTKIIYQFGSYKIYLDELQKKHLEDNINSNSIFEILLKECKLNQENVKLVIPRAEFLRYKKYLKKIKKPLSMAESENGITKADGEDSDNVREPRAYIPSAKGRKGDLKKIVFGGLQAFYDENGTLPNKGNAFVEFINFIRDQNSKKTKPDYLKKVEMVYELGDKKSNCIKIAGEKNIKNRKYYSSQFYKFMKEFTPKVEKSEPSVSIDFQI